MTDTDRTLSLVLSRSLSLFADRTRTHAQAHKLLPFYVGCVGQLCTTLCVCVNKNGAVVRNSSSSCKCVFCAERERVLVGNDESTKTTPNIPNGCVVGKELDTNMLLQDASHPGGIMAESGDSSQTAAMCCAKGV